MGWVYANDRYPYEGETHELLGKTYSGKTRTPMSRRLEWEEPKPAAPSKPKQPRAKAGPKPRGASAWD